MIEKLNIAKVRDDYDKRYDCHLDLCDLIRDDDASEYLDLALGISEPHGNYSAQEYGLGPQILLANASSTVVNLAKSFIIETDPNKMLESIYIANIAFLKVSVGSEMAMMLNPDIFWVANVRTVWTHLLVKHNFDTSKANEELKLYRSQKRTSEMDYKIWKEIYGLMQPSIAKVLEIVNDVSIDQDVGQGNFSYLWFDAIANSLYENFSGY